MEQYVTIIVTVVTVLGSAGAWQFYQKRMERKFDQAKDDKSDQNLYRDDLRERVAVLESKLEEERAETTRRQAEILSLQTTLTEYKVRLEFLEKENERLMYNRS